MLYALYYPQAAETELAPEVATFQYTIERMRHYHDEWHSVTATIFPNFRFLDCGEDVAEKLKKEHFPLIVIPDELSELLQDLCDKQHHIPMSKGVLQNGMAHVTEGPLTGHDNRIVRIDRHKRLAWLKVSENAPLNYARESTSVLIAGLEITEKLS